MDQMLGRFDTVVHVAQRLVEHLGDDRLAEREVEVLRRVAEGDRNRDISVSLSMSEETVEAHVRSIMGKLGAKDRTQAVSIGVRRGIIRLEPVADLAAGFEASNVGCRVPREVRSSIDHHPRGSHSIQV